MDWVEGVKIDRYISNNINNQTLLYNLFVQLAQLQQELRLIKIAHGDLQHGNILVTQSGQIRLVDYDGMYVPALRNYPPKNETGHSNYRHPNRSPRDYNEQLDDFSFDVIMLSLAATIIQPNLWNQFHTDNENFLFRKADFEKPDRSSVFSSVAQINDPDVQFLLQRLICRCKNLPLPTVQTANTQTSQTTQSNPQTPGNYTTVQVTPSQSTGGTIKISRPWPIWLTRLLVQVNNQLLILGIVSLVVVGFYWLVQLGNTQDKLTPIKTVEKFYETAPSNPKAALELGSDKFKKLVALDSKFWNSVEKIELFDPQILGKSESNMSLKLFVKYFMKDGTSKCEPTIIELGLYNQESKWLINNNVKLLESCPRNLQ
jgi:serine/threonine protein kinase